MTTPQAPSTLALGPEMTIVQAAGLRDALADGVREAPAHLALDLSGVTEFDSSAVQLLLAARKTLALRGHQLHLQAASPTVHDALRVFGLSSAFVPRDTPPA
jgi:anti-sigma B factor antagonist